MPQAIGAIILGVVVSVAVNLIVGFLFGKKKDDGSPTYGIGAMQTQTNSSMVMPIIYGRMKCAGNNLWQSGTLLNKASSDSETVQRLVGFGVGPCHRVGGVALNNKICQTSCIGGIYNNKYSDATFSITDGGPTDRDKTMTLYAGGNTTTIYLQDEGDYTKHESYDYNAYISKLMQYIQGIGGYTNTLAQQGWVLTDTVAVDNPPCDLELISTTGAYNNTVWIYCKGLDGCSYTAYMGDGEQSIDDRVPGATQRDKALCVGGLKYDAYLALTIHASDQLSGSPNVTALWEGRLVRIYTSLTSYTVAYSDNPAWCILDFYISEDGFGMPTTSIDIQSFIDAAAYFQPADKKRWWTLNIILDTKKKKQEWAAEMLLCCRSYPTYANGQHGILVEKAENVSQIFTVQPDEEIELYWQELSEDVERLFLKYIDPDYEWQWVIAPATTSTFRRPGNPVDKTIEIRGVTNFTQASQLSWFYLNQAVTCQGWLRYRTNRKALNRTVGDVVGIKDPITKLKEVNLDYKRYRIMSITETQGAGIEMVMREYNENLYNDTMGSVSGIIQTGTDKTSSNRTPPAITDIECWTNSDNEILVQHAASTITTFKEYRYYVEEMDT